ncbi:hypothetical protein PIIN_03001 [Serendipita indica DSM 11827]|uniref:Uncharacterized protein n=1 Tax=Serendipita indica (strain DSM 11827) TaxID=1109443 RepID=G4TCQ8_SERID|nr:hypothetical protein PIIN_03001 [Serendipita indica DSM 11827]
MQQARKIVRHAASRGCLQAKRFYHLPEDTYPRGDPRSIYDSRVNYLWQPKNHSDEETKAKEVMRDAFRKAIGRAQRGWFDKEEDDIIETNFRFFFVPYWLVRAGLYTKIDHGTDELVFTEGRIGIDISYSTFGFNHHALDMLHFEPVKAKVLDVKAIDTPPMENTVYIPFTKAPPFHHLGFYEKLCHSDDLLLEEHIRLRPQRLTAKIAARPVLDTIALAEFEYNRHHVTVAYSPRLGRDSIFAKGKWMDPAEAIGPSTIAYSVGWRGLDPKELKKDDYNNLRGILEDRARVWLSSAQQKGGSTKLDDQLWESDLVGEEAYKTVHDWAEAKVQLWDNRLDIEDWKKL